MRGWEIGRQPQLQEEEEDILMRFDTDNEHEDRGKYGQEMMMNAMSGGRTSLILKVKMKGIMTKNRFLWKAGCFRISVWVSSVNMGRCSPSSSLSREAGELRCGREVEQRPLFLPPPQSKGLGKQRNTVVGGSTDKRGF